MNKERAVIILLLAVILMISLIGVTSILNTPKQKVWVQVDCYEYDDFNDIIKTTKDFHFTTDRFTITGSDWRLTWQANAMEPVGSHFYVKIYDVSQNLITEIQSSAQENSELFTGNGESPTYSLQGKFYAEVSINGKVSGWKISVDEYK